MPRGNIHSRIEELEGALIRPLQGREAPQQTEAGRKILAFLKDYRERKSAGTLTPEGEEFADAVRAEVRKREARGEISRRGGGR